MNPCPCDDIKVQSTLVIPPGLVHIPRQVATFPEFRRIMLSSISGKPGSSDVSEEVLLSRNLALAGWRARSGDDFGVMLIEMWAYVCDVISFYDEVLAHEQYLSTARRRPSLRKLVGLLGYQPRPAISSTVELAVFAEGRHAVNLPVGTAFRSGSFDGNPPQLFELERSVTIHPFLNEWPLAPIRPSTFDLSKFGLPHLLLESGSVKLKRDDVVLLQMPDGGFARTVKELSKHDGQDGQTYKKVELNAPVTLAADVKVDQVNLLKPTATARLWNLPISSSSVPSEKSSEEESGILSTDPESAVARLSNSGIEPAPITTSASGSQIVLDGLYRQIRSGHYVLLSKDDEYRWFKVTKASERMRQFTPGTTSVIKEGNKTTTITTPPVKIPTTMLSLDASINANGRSSNATPPTWTASSFEDFTVHYGMIEGGTVTVEARTTFSANDDLIVKGPLENPGISGTSRFLLEDRNNEGLPISGILNFAEGSLTLDPTVNWDRPLDVPVQLLGNRITVSHGESVHGEILGSGNASLADQAFVLKKSPLTYLPSLKGGTQRSHANTLKVYVNGVLWSEVPSFFQVPEDAPVYTIRQNDQGESTITFGNGRSGRRLPTGVSNVVAYYRFGAGEASPPAGAIQQLGKPVPGLRSVRSPVAASGGADAEDANNLQTYAPNSALVLGRAVSILDMEAVAAGVGGVRAVSSEWKWNKTKQRPVVQIYYIGQEGLELGIRKTLRAVSDPSTPIHVARATPLTRALSIDIEIDPRFLDEEVLDGVRDQLLSPRIGLLAPERIGIGKPLFRSHIFKTVLSVDGVSSVLGLAFQGMGFSNFAESPGSGNYFDFPSDTLVVNAKEMAYAPSRT